MAAPQTYNFFQLPWFAMPATHKRSRIDEFCDGPHPPLADDTICCAPPPTKPRVFSMSRAPAESTVPAIASPASH